MRNGDNLSYDVKKGIYKIQNQINNKVYIGSSIDINRRWQHHKDAAFNINAHQYNYPLMQDFRKYGIENFSFEILELIENTQEMIEKEHNYIIQYNCIIPNGYNQTDNTNSPMFDEKVQKKVRDTKRKKYGKKIVEIDSNNNIIDKWNSIGECSEKTGLIRSKISSVCNGKRHTTGERIFRFIDNNGEIIEPVKQVNKTNYNMITKNSKKVAKLDNDNNELQIYDSISIAAKENNCDPSGISKVCNQKRNKCGGYKWKYKE